MEIPEQSRSSEMEDDEAHLVRFLGALAAETPSHGSPIADPTVMRSLSLAMAREIRHLHPQATEEK